MQLDIHPLKLAHLINSLHHPQFSEVIHGALDEFFPPESGVKVVAEPGRYFAESVFTLAAAAIARRVLDDVDDDSGNIIVIFQKLLSELLSNFNT